MEDYVHIAVLDTVTEAQLLASVLTTRNIPHTIRPHDNEAQDDLSLTGSGWGSVDAPQTYQKIIMFIISNMRKDADHHHPRRGDPPA